jgi:segregation and condensation protein B
MTNGQRQFMSLKPQLEAIIYAAETPISLDQIFSLVKESLLAETPGVEAAEMKSRVRAMLEELIADYSGADHGIEIRQVAGGYRMSTKPEQHDAVRAFAKSLKPPFRLSLPALETLAVIAYKQPVTVPEISEIRGVDAGGVIATLLDRKLITTAGRKAVIGRPILYRTSKEFLLRFGLKDINELPSMEEFEKLLAESFQSDMIPGEDAPAEESLSLPLTAGDDSKDQELDHGVHRDTQGQTENGSGTQVKDDSFETVPMETVPEEERAVVVEESAEPKPADEEEVTEAEAPSDTKSE